MQLKVKFLRLSAGRPVAILNKKFANDKGIHLDDRILIKRNSRKMIAVVDIAAGMMDKNEIVVSTEVSHELKLKEGSLVTIIPTMKPDSIPLIFKKMKCEKLNYAEIKEIISDIVKNALTESEIAYFVSSIFNCGMSMKEVEELTRAIVETGKRLNLRNKIIADKHSIGGMPGRTTPIVVSICSCLGLTMPKTSSRAITSPAGTADAMETICKVDFTIQQLKKIIHKTNACIVWGGTLGLAPADDKIIQVERLINIDPEAQLLASIMAKKIAVGGKYVLIEIPYGKYAKVDKKEALILKKKFESLAKNFDIKMKCIVMEIKEPSGNGIGPALEIIDVIKVLRREDPCYKLRERALIISGYLLELAHVAGKGKGYETARDVLDSGKAYKKFIDIVKAQDGNINCIKTAKFKHNILSNKNFKVKEINIKQINYLARALGCPANKLAGIYLYKHLKDKIKKGEKIMTLYSESSQELKEGIKFYNKINPFK